MSQHNKRISKNIQNMTSKTNVKGAQPVGSRPGREDYPDTQLDEQELEQLYAWVDSIPLSIPKKNNITRDFSDGVLVAEIIHHHFPTLVDLHNYSPASNAKRKEINWDLLNKKVFKKMNFELDSDLISDLALCKKGVIEKFLLMLQVKIRRAEYARERLNDKPEVDQHQMSNRKGTLKVGLEDTRGSQFAKTKQLEGPPKPGYKQEVRPKQRGLQIESDLVPRLAVEEKDQEIYARDETIQILQAKISRLEHLLHLKDMRIEDLQQRIEGMRPTGLRR